MGFWSDSKVALGSLVQEVLLDRSILSPYVGRVASITTESAQVVWPFGVSLTPVDNLVCAGEELFTRLNPSTKEGSQGSAITNSLNRLIHAGLNDLQVYDNLWHHYASEGIPDTFLRETVQKQFKLSSKLMAAYLSEQACRTAAYWVGSDRKYQATQAEVAERKVCCPNCKGATLRKTTYKMEDGVRSRLFVCPSCLHVIRQTEILGPGGSIVEW